MNPIRTFYRKLRSLWQNREVKREIDEELRFHLEQRTAENIAAGMPPEEAARAARKRFGNLQGVREECRDARGTGFGESVFQDIRFSLRMLRKHPGFTTVAVLTLALGLGANTAIFSLLYAAVLRPLPYHRADRLMVIQSSYPKLNLPTAPVSPALYALCRDNCKSFEDIAAFTWWSAAVTGQTQPEQLNGARATANFLPLLGIRPALGRYFTAEEDQFGRGRVVVLSDEFWHRKFNGDVKIIGRTITLNGTSYDVVGILPPGFKFTQAFDVWVPMAFSPEERQSRSDCLIALGALKPGTTATQAQLELDGVGKSFRDQDSFLGEVRWRILASPLQDYLEGRVRPILVLLFSAVVAVLLIACVNVATLLLVKGIAREKEMAIRTALGAGRMRLMRQLFVEGLVLSIFGAGAGLFLGRGLMAWIHALIPSSLTGGIAGWDHVRMDPHVLGFTLTATMGSAVIFGLAPVLQLRKSDLNRPLKESGNRSGHSVRHRRLRSLLVVGEIALATVLLAAAGLGLQSFLRALRVNPGFNPDQLVTLRVNLPESKYASSGQQRGFYDELVRRAGELPGVASVALISNPPLWGDTMSTFGIEGRDDRPHGSPGAVTSGYFETMKIPLVSGRYFTDFDKADSLPVAIIDEKLARRYWPNQSPLGKRILCGIEFSSGQPPWREIVGVVGEIKNLGLASEAKEQYYYPFSQSPAASMCLMVRCAGAPGAILESVRKQIPEIDPNQPVSYVTTVRSQLDGLLAPQRLPAWLVGGFAVLALGLAGIGLYGVVAYTSGQRTREFGIRLALGANPGQLVWLVLREGMGLVAIGLLVGLASGLALTRLMRKLLFEIGPDDPMTFISVSAILLTIALFACWLPARRAGRVDPVNALRYE